MRKRRLTSAYDGLLEHIASLEIIDTIDAGTIHELNAHFVAARDASGRASTSDG